MRPDDLYSVPPNLPVPVDDGACDHLVGLTVPDLPLPATTGGTLRVVGHPERWTVVYAYPRTGVPDLVSPPGWDEIPGARGCTPQNCAFRDHYAELKSLGATVFGLSTQSTAYQQEMAARLHLPFPVLSDEHLQLTHALRLPTFRYQGWTLIKRLSLILEDDRIAHVIYPVFPSNADAPAVLAWLRDRAKPDFSGEWTLNVGASALSPVVAPVVQRGFVHIQHREPTIAVHLSITMDGKPFDVRFERPSNWEGDALVFTDDADTPNGTLTIAFRYQLEESGRRLRATERLRGAGREQDNVWVFDRDTGAHA